jgi:hypothetical protein
VESGVTGQFGGITTGLVSASVRRPRPAPLQRAPRLPFGLGAGVRGWGVRFERLAPASGHSASFLSSSRGRALVVGCLALPLIVLAFAGCATSRCPAPAFDVPTAPPPPLPDEPERSSPPAPNMTFIPGYWSFGETPTRMWTWIPGHWLTAPEGTSWVAAETTGAPGDAHYRFRPGGFCSTDSAKK